MYIELKENLVYKFIIEISANFHKRIASGASFRHSSVVQHRAAADMLRQRADNDAPIPVRETFHRAIICRLAFRPSNIVNCSARFRVTIVICYLCQLVSDITIRCLALAGM